jgi:hypothetical protein
MNTNHPLYNSIWNTQKVADPDDNYNLLGDTPERESRAVRRAKNRKQKKKC